MMARVTGTWIRSGRVVGLAGVHGFSPRTRQLRWPQKKPGPGTPTRPSGKSLSVRLGPPAAKKTARPTFDPLNEALRVTHGGRHLSKSPRREPRSPMIRKNNSLSPQPLDLFLFQTRPPPRAIARSEEHTSELQSP